MWGGRGEVGKRGGAREGEKTREGGRGAAAAEGARSCGGTTLARENQDRLWDGHPATNCLFFFLSSLSLSLTHTLTLTSSRLFSLESRDSARRRRPAEASSRAASRERAAARAAVALPQAAARAWPFGWWWWGGFDSRGRQELREWLAARAGQWAGRQGIKPKRIRTSRLASAAARDFSSSLTRSWREARSLASDFCDRRREVKTRQK